MTFFIQASSPARAANPNLEDRDLRGAIEEAFDMETEDAVLNWNGVSVPLSYKYDLSVMVWDLLPMLSGLLSNAKGELEVGFPSNTFQTTWVLRWDSSALRCEAVWESVSGNVEPQLARSGPITTTRGEFLAEWRAPLDRISTTLHQAGFEKGGIQGWDGLDRIREQITGRGRLYQGPATP